MQTGMPGSRGRVAWGRQRPDEGGTNLYMPREVIASLALRGALAGARLRRRFDDETQTQRYRWLRLRIALANLQRLRENVTAGRAVYDPLVADDAWLADAERRYAYDPYSEGIDWYRPDEPAYWELARCLLDDLEGRTTPPWRDGENPLVRGGPKPQPHLRQVPPT